MEFPILKSMTLKEYKEKRDEKKINTDMQVQRPLTVAWTKEKRLSALKDSILKNWSIGVFQVIIDADETINMIDGKQRTSAIMSIIDNDLSLMTPDEQKTFLEYRIVLIDNAPLKMSAEEQADFFVRLNSGGVALTSAQVMRGKYSATLTFNKIAINNIATALNVSQPDAEKVFIMVHSTDFNQYDFTKNLYTWFQLNQPKNIVDNKKRTSAYTALIAHLDDSAQKRINRLIHQVMLLSTLTGNEDEKELTAYGAKLNAFFNSNSADSDNRKNYNNACHSATGDSANVKTRYDILMEVKTTPITTTAKLAIKSNEEKLADDLQHAKDEQAKADAKNSLELARQKAIGEAIANNKGTGPQPVNNFKRK